MKRFWLVLLFWLAAASAFAQTTVQFGLATGTNPSGLCVYDLAHNCVVMGSLDSVAHTYQVANAGLAPMAAATIKGNSTGAAANPQDVSLTAMLDASFGSARDKVLARGPSGWTATAAPAAIGPCDGSTDLTAALNAALAALPANGGEIDFAAGKCFFASSISYTYPGTAPFTVTFRGEGASATWLYWTGAAQNGLSYALSSPRHSFHFRDLSFVTGAAGGGIGFAASNSVQLGTYEANSLDNVTFESDDGNAAHYWGTDASLAGLSSVNVTGSIFYGDSSGAHTVGLLFAGVPGGSAKYATVLNIQHSDFIADLYGLELTNYWQNVQIVNSSFEGGAKGVYQPASATGTLEQLGVVNSQFNTAGAQIDIETAIVGVSLSNNLLIVPASQTGVYLAAAGSQNAIVGNVFSGLNLTGSVGLYVNAAATFSTASANSFYNLGVGLQLAASAANWNVSGNVFQGDTTSISNAGTSNRISGNVGYNPVGTTAATSTGTTGSTITAGASPETHYIRQAATFNAAVTKNGNAICTVASANAPCVVDLGPSESYSVTWATTQPNYTRDVH